MTRLIAVLLAATGLVGTSQAYAQDAAPLLPRDRSLFLEDVAAALRGFDEIGDGVVARVAREVQRKYLRPPDLSRSRDCSRYRR